MARLPLIFEAVGYVLVTAAAFMVALPAGIAVVGAIALWEAREAQR